MTKTMLAGARRGQQGATLVLVALSLVILLGISALAIDLVALYVARSEAQRAADAAALAGADVFVTSGYSSGLVTQGAVQTMAAAAASAVGNKNLVGGQNPLIGTNFSGTCPPSAGSDGCFNFSIAGDPRITVVVQRTAARNNPMPTFFIKIFGITKADVSAQATAEAYNPSGGGPPVGVKCLKPWILPNCDPNHPNPALANSNCGSPAADYFYNNSLCANTSIPGICYPGSAASGGAIGEKLTLKPGIPQSAPAPSQFYPVDIPPGTTPAQCPAPGAPGCGGGISSGGGGPGASLYRQNIACCNTNNIVCGNVSVNWKTGNMQGPTRQGVECLIHANGAGPNQGQDTITYNSTNGFTITAGSNNPNPNLVGKNITSSDSLVTVPLYDGSPPCPGQSCGSSVAIVGFLQVFLEQVDNQGNVLATVMGISGCGSGGSGNPSPVSTGGTSPIPVRLVQPGN
jgi:Flp pilus assembly protein TadG